MRVFELVVLRTLSIGFVVAALFYVMHMAWPIVFAMALCWFLVGAIGQGLPHRKPQTFSELASGLTPEPYNDVLSDRDAFAVTKAALQIGAVVALAALALTWNGFRWYMNLLAMAAGFGITFIVSVGLVTIFGHKKSSLGVSEQTNRPPSFSTGRPLQIKQSKSAATSSVLEKPLENSMIDETHLDRNERSVNQMHRGLEEMAGREYQPIADLGLAIIRAATKSRDATKHLIEAVSETKRLEKEVYVFFEYIYAYTHLAIRYSAAALTKSQVERTQSFLSRLIPDTAIDSYFHHWPQDMKKKMVGEFIDKLNEAEFEYTEVVSSSLAETASAKLMDIFLRLALRVSNVCVTGSGPNMLILNLSIREWEAMEIQRLTAEISRS